MRDQIETESTLGGESWRQRPEPGADGGASRRSIARFINTRLSLARYVSPEIGKRTLRRFPDGWVEHADVDETPRDKTNDQ